MYAKLCAALHDLHCRPSATHPLQDARAQCQQQA